MCRKTQFVFLIALALISSTTSRFINDNDNDVYESSEELFGPSKDSGDWDDYNSKEGDGLPLYRIVSGSDEKEMDDKVFDELSKEDMGESEEAEVELDDRIGIPMDYESNDRNGVVLRNKIGENNGEEKNPGWLRRQWRRLGHVATAITQGKKVSTEKVNEFTEKICTLIKFMTSRASKICELVPLQICESFYGQKTPDNVIYPETNSVNTIETNGMK